MPVLYFLKNPRSTIAVKGQLDQKEAKTLAKALGQTCIQGTAMDGQPILIPTREDCNIAYIKQITTQEFQKAQDEIKKQQESEPETGRIVRPEFAPGHRRFPGGKKR